MESSHWGQLSKEKAHAHGRARSFYWFCFSVQWVQLGPWKGVRVPARVVPSDRPPHGASPGTWCSLSQILL